MLGVVIGDKAFDVDALLPLDLVRLPKIFVKLVCQKSQA